MEPHRLADSHDLGRLRIDVLRRAVDVYLELAYAKGPMPEVARHRLEWPCHDAPTLLAGPPFERAGKAAGAGGSPIFALRLGNACYPHMKLQIQPWPNADGFLLSVNTHDQVLGLDPNAADAAAFRELQAENQRLKELIEQAWDQAGLPTFLGYLRQYLESRDDGAQTPPAGGPES
jgi:hypothetical protein